MLPLLLANGNDEAWRGISTGTAPLLGCSPALAAEEVSVVTVIAAAERIWRSWFAWLKWRSERGRVLSFFTLHSEKRLAKK